MILGMGKSFSSSTSPNRTTHSTPSLSPASSKPTNKYQYSRYSQKMSSYIDSPAWTQTETVDTHHHQHHHHINASHSLRSYLFDVSRLMMAKHDWNLMVKFKSIKVSFVSFPIPAESGFTSLASPRRWIRLWIAKCSCYRFMLSPADNSSIWHV